jgi:hypothetical protein
MIATSEIFDPVPAQQKWVIFVEADAMNTESP